MLTTTTCMSSTMPTPLNPSSSSSSPPQTGPPQRLSVRTIPGSYGWPVIGPLSDRLDYFWFQGQEKFFRKRIDEHKSTVFRTNVPPSFPFFVNVNPNVIAVLDCKSFSHLFDMDIIEKKNILVGDFMPSVSFTGNTRVCAYLDTAEEEHTKAKSFAMEILKRSSREWITSLLSSLDTMWTTIEQSLSEDEGKAVSPLVPLQKCLFTFLSKSLAGADPSSSPEILDSGYVMINKWLAFQLLPTIAINRFQPLEEIFLHSFSYPFALIKGDYEKLAEFITKEGKEVVELGQTEFGLTKQETIHNIIFILGFNAFGGFSVFLPTLLTKLATSPPDLQLKLRNEVRQTLLDSDSGSLSFKAVSQMPNVESFVYEALRLNPPVPLQYGRARKDFVLSSHEAAFPVEKGELLCGFQKLVMRDPKVFDEPERFVPDRFVGESGRKLLDYLYWSNGPQTGEAGVGNKQCAAKEVVPLTAALFVAYLFQRYDSITSDSSGSITKLVKAGTTTP